MCNAASRTRPRRRACWIFAPRCRWPPACARSSAGCAGRSAPSGCDGVATMINQIDEHDPDRTVSIIGLGYVGLTLAVIMAEAGFRVRGVEINPAFTDQIRQGRAHF